MGLSEVRSLRFYRLLLVFHDTREDLSQSVRQSDKFIQYELHSWAAVKSWNCGTLCVCVCMRVHAFNPSVICFLLPSHECRDVSIRPWSLWKDTAISCVAQHLCSCWWRGKRGSGAHRTERDTQKIKMKVTQAAEPVLAG